MPKISQNKGSGGRIIFDADDWVTGLMPNYSTSNLANIKGKGLASSRSMNPFRQFGYAAPGFQSTDVTNVSEVTAICRNGVVNSTSGYIVTAGPKLQKLDLANSSLTVSFHSTTAHSGHSSVVGDDCVLYNSKVSGTNASRFFWTWVDNTDWDVGMYDFSSFTDSFMTGTATLPSGTGTVTTNGTTTLSGSGTAFTTQLRIGDRINVSGETVRFVATISSDTSLTVTSAFSTSSAGLSFTYFPVGSTANVPHPMIVGADDILYIGDRNFVHAFDGQTGSNGTFSPAVLTLPENYRITCFARTDTGLIICAYLANPGSSGQSFYFGNAIAFLWDYNNLDITRSYDLNDNYVSEIVNYKGTLACFTQGRPNDLQTTKPSVLRIFNGSVFEPVMAFDANVPIRGGVEVIGNVIYWNADGKVYSYGSPITGTTAGLHKLTEGLGTTSGMLRYFTTTQQWASTGTTTSGGLQLMTTNYYSQTSFSTGLAEPTFGMNKKGVVKQVKVRFGATASGGRDVTISLSDKGVASSTVINSQSTVTGQAGLVVCKIKDTSDANFIDFDALKAIVSWGAGSAATDAPVISSIEVEYEEKDVSIT